MTQDKEENHLIEERRKKLAELRAAEKAYPNDFKRKNLAGEIKEELDQFSKEELEKKKKKVSVAGRIMLRRMMGKASFTTIQDFSGRIQLYVRADEVGLSSKSFSMKGGGLSGKNLYGNTLRLVQLVSSQYDFPIIATGGVSSYDNVRELLDNGASLTGVATLLVTDPFQIPLINYRLSYD